MKLRMYEYPYGIPATVHGLSRGWIPPPGLSDDTAAATHRTSRRLGSQYAGTRTMSVLWKKSSYD